MFSAGGTGTPATVITGPGGEWWERDATPLTVDGAPGVDGVGGTNSNFGISLFSGSTRSHFGSSYYFFEISVLTLVSSTLSNITLPRKFVVGSEFSLVVLFSFSLTSVF